MSKHTPGPWTIKTVEPGEEWHVNAPKMRWNSGRWDSLAIIYGDEDKWETKKRREGRANAHLIAAAPELLDVLRDLVRLEVDNRITLHGQHVEFSDDFISVIEAAEDAIAKAEGAGTANGGGE